MRRGEVYRLRIPRDPRGHEQRGARFGIVVQAEELLPLSTVLISPTSASAAPATFRPVIDVDGSPTRVLVEQTTAVSRERLGDSYGVLSASELAEVDSALAMLFGL